MQRQDKFMHPQLFKRVKMAHCFGKQQILESDIILLLSARVPNVQQISTQGQRAAIISPPFVENVQYAAPIKSQFLTAAYSLVVLVPLVFIAIVKGKDDTILLFL